MINSILRYVLISTIIILLQILLFNNIQFSGYINPYVYIMIILILPTIIPTWILLIIAFFTGLIIDLFSGSPGMHTFATVLAAFFRPYVLTIISPRDGYESGSEITMAMYGARWYFLYTITIVLLHHTTLFYIEVFRLSGFFRTLLRVILSSAFTTGFILLAEFYRRKRG